MEYFFFGDYGVNIFKVNMEEVLEQVIVLLNKFVVFFLDYIFDCVNYSFGKFLVKLIWVVELLWMILILSIVF